MMMEASMKDNLSALQEENDSCSVESGDTHDGSGDPKEPEQERVLAQEETNAVHCLRLVVLAVLVGVAVLFSVGVYWYMKQDEKETFESQFYDLANRLVSGFHANAKLRLQVIHMFATSITSTVQQTNQVWPFVVIDDYEARATATRAILGSVYLAIYPIVSKDLRRVWEEFTLTPKNLEWINQTFDFQAEFFETHGRNYSLSTYGTTRRLDNSTDDDDAYEPFNNTVEYVPPFFFSPQIYRRGDPDNNPSDMGDWVYEDQDAPGPFFPMWQISPLTTEEISSINYNVLDPFYPAAYVDGVKVVADTQQAVFAGVWNVNDEGFIIEDDDYNDAEVPITSLLYPLFNKVTGDDKELVAVVELNVEFGPFFSSVLPSNSNSIVCVVSNCHQIFTFEVTGETAVYLGPNDLHDPKYDNFVVAATMADFETSAGGTVYNGVPVNQEWCPWELQVYATSDMESEFLTSNPIYYMLVVLAVFFLTFLTFVGYDFLVGRRHSKVMTTAVKSDKIVASLFPTTFREALYEDDNNKETGTGDQNKRDTFNWKGGKDHIRSLLDDNNTHTVAPMKVGVMAQLYEDCTVFFCDIVGFTAWSSDRSPEQVFTLLETIYGAFDKLAARHRVFKIETIGDCYVAVTGLPEPQPNHALLMVKFSRDCLSKMTQLTSRLELTLGRGTRDLAVRIGLHSGPVTAGILRGQKARFQLFGDTVNTASRMESTGLKHCIHASKETAGILAAMGKEHWVHAREDRIHAKGKGDLQTYWIRPVSSASAATSISFSVLDNFEDELDEVPSTSMALTPAPSPSHGSQPTPFSAWAFDTEVEV